MKTIVPTDGMRITENTRLAPGVYSLPRGITIAVDGITLDGTDALLVGKDYASVGICAEGRKGITIQGVSIAGYYHGIRLSGCQDVTIENVRVRDTAEIEGIDTFLYLWHPIEKAYSGAILLDDVAGGVIRHNDVQHQMNGILLYGCSGLVVEKNNASFNSGWGVYLSASSDNVVQDNCLDFCNRVYRRPDDGSVRVEADAAGIVLVYSSSRNKFLRNSCLCGGDGIFVAGYDHKGNQGPCNDNLFEDNDCCLSSNNAIESTFSRGNIFRRNDCSQSNYGMWMGYSWENVIEENIIEFNRQVGVAIEHGFDCVIRNNQIRFNSGDGVRLWTRGGPVVAHWPGHEVSHDFVVENNLIEANHTGFHGYTGAETTDRVCYGYHLRGNTLRNNRIGVRLDRVVDCSVEANVFERNVEKALWLEGHPGVALRDNRFDGNAADVTET